MSLRNDTVGHTGKAHMNPCRDMRLGRQEQAATGLTEKVGPLLETKMMLLYVLIHIAQVRGLL